jgi:hypothetical protein
MHEFMPGRQALFNSLIGTSFEVRHWLSLEPTGFLGILVSYGTHLFALVMSPSTPFLNTVLCSGVSTCSSPYGASRRTTTKDWRTAEHDHPGGVSIKKNIY